MNTNLKKQKKAVIYSPYLETAGGGERYVVEIIRALLQKQFQVSLVWKSEDIKQVLSQRYDIDLSSVGIDMKGHHHIEAGNVLGKTLYFHKFDLAFFVSDGSIPTLTAKKNLLHFQVPFKHHALSHLDKAKLRMIDVVVCNSLFTKAVIDDTYRTRNKSAVLYPPCTAFKPQEKKPIILSVGRFDDSMQSKRHDVLIDAFLQGDFKNWQLVLVGGSQKGERKVTALKEKIKKNNQISIRANVPFDELKSYYQSASLFWHAAGYGADLIKKPEQAEHFGISIVEAMSAGAVPLVFAGGGPLEIVTHGISGFHWDKPQELISLSQKLMHDENIRTEISKNAMKRSNDFSPERFQVAFQNLIS